MTQKSTSVSLMTPQSYGIGGAPAQSLSWNLLVQLKVAAHWIVRIVVVQKKASSVHPSMHERLLVLVQL
uniref:Uncharacterized protein n=1 Tax=Rhizophora mucronata TaxID=61149 RepID=A0A2P2QN28_RHIMU